MAQTSQKQRVGHVRHLTDDPSTFLSRDSPFPSTLGAGKPVEKQIGTKPLRPRQTSRLLFLSALFLFVTVSLFLFWNPRTFRRRTTISLDEAQMCSKGVLSIVAHPDDDLIFQSPDLLTFAHAQECLTVVFLTSGDAGYNLTYSENRERGGEVAYSYMAGVTDSWTNTYVDIFGKSILLRKLRARPNIQRLYLRLPDGSRRGVGYPSNHYGSLARLFGNKISSLKDRYGHVSYTSLELQNTMRHLIDVQRPRRLLTLDHLGFDSTGDHSDHSMTARLIANIYRELPYKTDFEGYMGYPAVYLPENVDNRVLSDKMEAFFLYANYDERVQTCTTMFLCEANAPNRSEYAWLHRQYSNSILNPETWSPEPRHRLPPTKNLALDAKIQCSSTQYGYSAFALNDNKVKLDTVNTQGVWLSFLEEHPFCIMKFAKPVRMNTVVLYDLPDPDNQILSSLLTFGDGTHIALGPLFNDGSATVFTLPTLETDSIRLTITNVSEPTKHIGIVEWQAFLQQSVQAW